MSRDICKFLLTECPHLVKVGDRRSELPIHSLLRELYVMRSQREVYSHFASLHPDQNKNKKVIVKFWVDLLIGIGKLSWKFLFVC